LGSLPVIAGLIPFHIVLREERVMAEALWNNGGQIEPVDIAGTSAMIHRLLPHIAKLLKA
jgi:hypothetical protein